MISDIVHRSRCLRFRRWLSKPLLTAVACVACFSIGYWTSDRRLPGRVEGRIAEFLQIADSLGIIDRKRLEEAIITMSEAEWEDRDFEQNQGMTVETNAP
jgi:hypothetical protein